MSRAPTPPPATAATPTAGPSSPGPTGSGSPARGPAWATLAAARPAHLAALGRVIAASVRRRDSDHPAFHGCYDWHSAVHGAYALLVLARLTGDAGWAEAAAGSLDPGALAAEARDLAAGRLDHELPYGHGWLLLLAREAGERPAALGQGAREALGALAAAAAARLEAWLEALPPAEVERRLSDGAHGNLAWPLLNLLRWREARGGSADSEGADPGRAGSGVPGSGVAGSGVAGSWRSRARAWLEAGPWREPSPWLEPGVQPWGREPREFFDPALVRLHALLELWPEPALARAALRAGPLPTPIRDPATVHHAGQNFSRAWALWSLFRASGEPRCREAYAAHLTASLGVPASWGGDYTRAHWIPQFGVEALRLSLDDSAPAAGASGTGHPAGGPAGGSPASP